MSMWAGTCQLVMENTVRGSRGVPTTIHTARAVPCNVYEVSARSYYAASAAGIHPRAVIELRRCAYRGETLVRFDGELLSVERAQKTPDNVRLTLVERTGDRGDQ